MSEAKVGPVLRAIMDLRRRFPAAIFPDGFAKYPPSTQQIPVDTMWIMLLDGDTAQVVYENIVGAAPNVQVYIVSKATRRIRLLDVRQGVETFCTSLRGKSKAVPPGIVRQLAHATAFPARGAIYCFRDDPGVTIRTSEGRKGYLKLLVQGKNVPEGLKGLTLREFWDHLASGEIVLVK